LSPLATRDWGRLAGYRWVLAKRFTASAVDEVATGAQERAWPRPKPPTAIKKPWS